MTTLPPSQEALDQAFNEAAIAYAWAGVQTLFHQNAYLAISRKYGIDDITATRTRNAAMDAYMQELELHRTLVEMMQNRAHMKAVPNSIARDKHLKGHGA
jgi:hypothetical protein